MAAASVETDEAHTCQVKPLEKPRPLGMRLLQRMVHEAYNEVCAAAKKVRWLDIIRKCIFSEARLELKLGDLLAVYMRQRISKFQPQPRLESKLRSRGPKLEF
jgi:hypothetical protein